MSNKNTEVIVVRPGYEYALNEVWLDDGCKFSKYKTSIVFQEGSIEDVGVNGFSSEDVIRILIDHLEFLNKDSNDANIEKINKQLKIALGLFK